MKYAEVFMELTQSQILLQMIRKFKEDLSSLEQEVYASIPHKKVEQNEFVLMNPLTGKPFHKKAPAPTISKAKKTKWINQTVTKCHDMNN